MAAKYLELDSTYRNRSMWPLPSQFEVEISQSGSKNKDTALDPLALSAPVTTWKGNTFITGGGASITVVYNNATSIGLSNDNLTFFVSSASSLQPIDDYYVGAAIEWVNGAITERRRIKSYKYITLTAGSVVSYAQIEVDTYFGSAFPPAAGNNSMVIYDPTSVVANTSGPYVFVPAGRTGNNSYYNNYLYNQTVGQYRTITGYDGFSHTLTLDATGTAGTSSGIVTGWANTDVFSIRKDIPLFVGTVTGVTVSTLTLSGLASSETSIYNNFYLRQYAVAATTSVIRRITAYNGTTKLATVYPSFSSILGAGTPIEILQFTRDNYVPFTYNGSMASQQEEVCYRVVLTDLVIPSITLKSGFGSRVAFYPYLYVELRNITGSSAGNRDVIYSNNPNASKMLFRCPVNDIADPLSATFVKLNGDGIAQTIKFKINDSMRFSVYLPDGTLFNTIYTDSVSPTIPKGEIQISAQFALERV